MASLSNHEITQYGIIQGSGSECEYFNGGCFLTTGLFIDLATGKQINDSYILPRQGMVFAISKENLVMPSNIIGYATVKNSMSTKGLLSLNIGIVDSSSIGPIGSVIINFSSKAQTITIGEQYLRMTFHKTDTASVNKVQIDNKKLEECRKQYIAKAGTNLGYLGAKFLSFDEVIKEISEETKKSVKDSVDRVLRLALSMIAILGIVLAFIINFKALKSYFVGEGLNTKENNINWKLDSLEYKLQKIEERIAPIEDTN